MICFISVLDAMARSAVHQPALSVLSLLKAKLCMCFLMGQGIIVFTVMLFMSTNDSGFYELI